MLHAGADSVYFAVTQKLRASDTSDLLADNSTSTHMITKRAWLYNVAGMLLQGIFWQPHAFDAVAINAAARNLRSILVSTEPLSDGSLSDGSTSLAVRNWTYELYKDAEKQESPCVWSLLLPMIDGRAALIKEVQTMTSIETAGSSLHGG